MVLTLGNKVVLMPAVISELCFQITGEFQFSWIDRCTQRLSRKMTSAAYTTARLTTRMQKDGCLAVIFRHPAPLANKDYKEFVKCHVRTRLIAYLARCV